MTAGSKAVGVLGGMGPAATLDFFARVLGESKAGRDQEHIRLIIDCNPAVPDRNAAVAGTGPSPAPVLQDMARGLARAGAEILVMPCNAAHAFVADVKGATDLPVISIIDVTVEGLRRALPQLRSAGVLASTGCLDAGLYQTALAEIGVAAVVPTGETRDRFMSVLYRIKSGDTGAAVKSEMIAIADALIAQGAQAIIAGCTEVPLVLAARDVGAPLLNSTDCLVLATIAAARGDVE
jgi:aspartate racemase